VVESRLPKPLVAGSIPVSRSISKYLRHPNWYFASSVWQLPYLKSKLAYNLVTLRKPAAIVLSLPFLAVLALNAPLRGQQTGPSRVSRLLLIIPFENISNATGID
jgi:hypothetical protein